MKNYLSGLLGLLFVLFVFSACEKDEDETGTPPAIPPYETMSTDFGTFTDKTKTAETLLTDTTKWNYALAGITAGYWNIMLTVTLAVPVASFAESFKNEAVFIGDKTWEWSYEVKGFAATYKARLTGQMRPDDIKWEMYVAKEGVGEHAEFKWFEGTSALDGNSGQWVLYHSYEVQEPVLQIDWKKSGEEIGEIKYSYIRASDNGDKKQLSKDSYIQYGLTEEGYDAFYNIHYTTRDIEAEGFLDVNIEWSTTNYNGRIKAEHYFNNAEWHCWDNLGYDAVCK